MSKCKGKWHLQVCAKLWDLQKECGCLVVICDYKTRFVSRQICRESSLRNCIRGFLQVLKNCKDLDFILFCILALGTYIKFVRKHKMPVLVLGVCFPQPCSSAGRRFAESRSFPTTNKQLICFHTTTQTNSMKCLVNWIPLRIRVCSSLRNTHPPLKGGLGISWTNMDCQ